MLEKIKRQMATKSPGDGGSPPKPKSYRFISLENGTKTSTFFGSDPKLEVEIGFGRFTQKGFVPGVTQGEFESLLRISNKRLTKNREWYDIVMIDTVLNVRKISEDDVADVVSTTSWQKKERGKDKVEDRHWGYRVSTSKEVPISPPKKFNPSVTRKRKRYSFDLGKFTLDLTQVFDGVETKYEVEVERTSKPNLEEIDEAIGFVLFGLAGGREPLSLPERSYVVSMHNSLFANDKDVRVGTNPFHLTEGYWNKPKNIKKDDILMSDLSKFSSTVKYDGKRVFILIDRGVIYECAPPYDLRLLVRTGRPSKAQTLLDAELVVDTYHVFDILFAEGRDVRGERFTNRLSILNKIVSSLKIPGIVPKKFYTKGDFYTVAQQALEEMASTDAPVDGIIFQPSHFYKNKHTKKWKPEELLTIDFKLVRKDGGDKYNLLVARYTRRDKREDVPFTGSRRNPIDLQYIEVPGGEYEGLKVDGLVVECKWVGGGDFPSFEIVRTREDKGGVPNEERVAGDVWDDIVDPITEATIKGEDLIIMRRLHNLLKTRILEDTFKKGDTIMDWGSGRGGDLAKWDRIGFRKVFVVEPNEDNFAILQQRLKESTAFKTKIVPVVTKKGELVGGEDTAALMGAVGKDILDGIVSFFSLTFFGKDMDTFRKGIRSLTELLPIGGKFVGIVMDGDRVKEFIKKGTDTKAFTITKLSKFSDVPQADHNEIDIKIHDPTSMVDYQEWLFYFDLFVKEMTSSGFELESTSMLDESFGVKVHVPDKDRSFSELFNNLANDAKQFSAANRYFSFVKVSAAKEKSSSERDFFHAILSGIDDAYSKLDEKNRERRSIKFRSKISEKITFENFKTMVGGCVRKTMVEVVVDAISTLGEDFTKREIEEYAFITFQESIIENKIDYRMIVDFISDFLKVNIHVTSPKGVYHTTSRYTKDIDILEEEDETFLLVV